MFHFLSEKHRNDLYSSGLSNDIIEESGIYTASPQESCELLERKDIDCECMVIPYLATEEPYFIRLKPDGLIVGRDGKPSKYLQKAGTESRLYWTNALGDSITHAMDSTLPLLWVEGEKKALKATMDLFYSEPYMLPIGLGGVWNWMKSLNVWNEKKQQNEVKQFLIKDFSELNLKNRLVYICFDSDIETNELIKKAEEELSFQIRKKGALSVASIRLPSKDDGSKMGIDDYLVLYGVDKFKELVEQSSSSHIIKYHIKMIRNMDQSNTDRLDMITDLVIKDQKAVGKFYVNNSGGYYLYNKEKKVLGITEELYKMLIANLYGLYRSQYEFKSILSKVEEESCFNGLRTVINNFSFFSFNDGIGRVFLYNNEGKIYIISNTGITLEYNGYDSVLFKHHQFHDPIKYKPNCKGYVDKYLFDVANFTQSEYTLLSPEQQKFLFTIWLYTLFFPNLMPTKPILVMTGDYGSGKSTIQRLVGNLLFGSNFNVTTLQSERDFLTSIISRYYLVYDNVDIDTDWVRNSIASLATGFKVEIRKLYTNLEIFEADPICYLAMNSMSQSIYKRPDVASRLLIFRTKALAEKKPQYFFTKNLLDNRNEILSEMIDNLKEIIPYVNNDFTYSGEFRMADFANIGMKIAAVTGREYELKSILEIMAREQSILPLEDNPIIDMIEKWLAKGNSGKYISTSDLFVALKGIADEHKMPFLYKSTVSFGKVLSSSFENLKQILDVEIRKGGGNKTMWVFSPKGTT